MNQIEIQYTDSYAPDSTAINTVVYDEPTGNLFLWFTNGSTWYYTDVEPEVFEGFKTAPSAGRYYQQAVKGKFSGEKEEIEKYLFVKRAPEVQDVTKAEDVSITYLSGDGDITVTLAGDENGTGTNSENAFFTAPVDNGTNDQAPINMFQVAFKVFDVYTQDVQAGTLEEAIKVFNELAGAMGAKDVEVLSVARSN